ncbi:MAG: phosphomannomutase/phosphoglucomutase [Ilumatobacteraceae bacterium]|nr:phosphomannomutase/phosphoglucomutase [Ilumatobacteraceae bacterium]
MADLSRIVKAYDVRGVVPEEFDVSTARALGSAFARYVGSDAIVVGRDMRPSGPAFIDAFAEGAQDAGVNVIDLGLVSTDLLYFASGSLDLPGAVFTASHNPAQYNGIKFCQAGARPVGIDSGLADVRDAAQAMLDGDVPEVAAERGQREQRDMLDAFVDHVMSFVDISALKPMRVVADTANGMGGLVVPALFERLPMIELEVMYGDLDGTFPNHPADPLQPANQRDLQARVVSGGFDIGLAFDGDADRVFIVDEKGVGLSGSVTTAILAVAMLRDHPGSTILHNLICSKAVPETISAHGGNPVRTRVGHSYIKTEMASRNAVFGGEHSAHYYFANNFRADSGLIASLIMISELARSGSTLSEMRRPHEPYVASGEINTVVDDPSVVIDRVREAYSHCDLDELDGLTVDAGEWWFNLRPSNTEPLLRLNLEAADVASCDAHVAEVLDIITA